MNIFYPILRAKFIRFHIFLKSMENSQIIRLFTLGTHTLKDSIRVKKEIKITSVKKRKKDSIRVKKEIKIQRGCLFQLIMNHDSRLSLNTFFFFSFCFHRELELGSVYSNWNQIFFQVVKSLQTYVTSWCLGEKGYLV